MMQILDDYLVHFCGAANVFRDQPLAKYTSFRVGGPAKYVVKVPDKATLQKLVSALEFLDYPYFILGLGANTLASDQGYDGVIIKLDFHEIYHNDAFVYADAGAKLANVIDYARRHGLSGLEWAFGIPATVGGAVYMNCGAFGKAMQDPVIMVDILEHGVVKTLTVADLDFGYRHSVFMERPAVILGAYFRLQPKPIPEITATMREIIAKRQNHPKLPSAGSTFKRPFDGFYVGRELQKLGLAGFQIGGAQISPNHCNFVVNTGQATCDDVLKVIYHAQDAIEKATGVLIEPEIIFLGKI